MPTMHRRRKQSPADGTSTVTGSRPVRVQAPDKELSKTLATLRDQEGQEEPAASLLTIESTIAAELLDKLNRGVIVLDGTGRPRFANQAARRMIEEGGALSIKRGRLSFLDGSAQARFQSYLKAANDHRNSVNPCAIRIPSDNRSSDYRVLLTPLRVVDDESSRHALLIYEPHGRRFVSLPILTQLYGLSAAEAEVSNRLFEGASLDTVAADLGVSPNTVKTLLQRIFRKCEVHSQGELLQLLALGPRTL